MSDHITPDEPVRQLELTRASNERRLYCLEGIGTLRREAGLFSHSFIAEADGHRWRFTSRGIMQRKFEATDRDGTVVGTFVTRAIRRGGQLDWGTDHLALVPAGLGHERYVLTSNDRDIIVVAGKSWGRHPVMVTMIQPGATDPGLVLFVAFVVRRLAINAASVAGSVVAATAASASS